MAGNKGLPLEHLKIKICSVNFTKKNENNTVHLRNIKYTVSCSVFMFQDGELSILELYGINKTPIHMQFTRRHHPHLRPQLRYCHLL